MRKCALWLKILWWHWIRDSHLGNTDLSFNSTGPSETATFQFSHSVISDSLRLHEPQHARPPSPWPTPGVHQHPYPLSQWCHPTFSSSVFHPLLLLSSNFPSIRVFSNESVRHIRWPKYWSFSFNICPSNEYSGLISFRIDWFDLLSVQGTLESLLQHHNLKASIFRCSAFLMIQLTSLRDYWKN